MILRQNIEYADKRAALVTNNRTLTRRVAAILKKWDIEIDDSEGIRLSETPEGIFIMAVAEMVATRLSPTSLLSVLKNPFTSAGLSSVEFKSMARKFEIDVLRGPRFGNDFSKLLAKTEKTNNVELTKWLQNFINICDEFFFLFHNKKTGLKDLIKYHIQLCENLAKNNLESGPERLWSNEGGKQLQEFINQLLSFHTDFPDIDALDYPELFESLLKGQVYRKKYNTHPRISVLSPMEARLQQFDLVVVAGLNQGDWPKEQINPWMSNSMLEDMGIDYINKKLALSSYDFYSLFCTENLVISRSLKVGGEVTVPSSWLLRLDTILNKCDLNDIVLDTKVFNWSNLLNKPDRYIQIKEPKPTPHLDSRPKKLSATDIEKLIKDPYSIYASHILKLRPLREIDEEPGVKELGSLIHKALEYFVNDYKEGTIEESIKQFEVAGERAFKESFEGESVGVLWWPRFIDIAPVFVSNEKSKREQFNKVLAR